MARLWDEAKFQEERTAANKLSFPSSAKHLELISWQTYFTFLLKQFTAKSRLPSIILPTAPGKADLLHLSLLTIRVFNYK